MKQFLVLLFLMTGAAVFAQQKAYYRMPAIYNNSVVFTTEGDLWKYDMASGISMRLTSHQGVEAEPAFSSDGKSIVFTAEYEGPQELYIIPSEGGVPKRITFENIRGIKAIKWAENGKILYTTRTHSLLDDNQLAWLDPKTLVSELIPLAQAADGDLDAAGNLYFTRFSFQGSNTKRYQGGTAQNIWKFKGNAASNCLTCDYTGTSREAMMYKDRVYFASDRDGTMNIWSMNNEGKDLKQHTFYSGWDVQAPYIHQSKIVYQKGADIGVYDIDKNEDKLLDIRIHSDFDQRRPRWIKNPEEKITTWEVSPEGKFVAFISRGRIFVSPSNGSRWVEVTRKSGIRYSGVQFLDEKNLVYLSDESGEFEVWKVAADGSGTPQQLTRNSKVLITSLFVSPDGKYIGYGDKDFKLMLYTVSTGTTQLIEQSEYGSTVHTAAWSKDASYLTYFTEEANTNTVIKVFDTRTGKKERITSDRLNSFDPQFSYDGKWLYFTSEREFKSVVESPWGPRQPEPYFDKMTKLYALALDEKEVFPFAQPDGWNETKKEAEEKSKDDKGESAKKKSKPAAPAPASLDWQAAAKRLYELPLASRNVSRLRVGETHLYWTENEAGVYDKHKLYALKVGYDKKAEPTLIAEDIAGFDLSANKKKLIVDKNNSLYLTEANGEKIDLDKTRIDLSNWSFQFDPIDDWKQMFADAWRMERDYFYDRNLHGVDWLSTRKRYETLLERVTDRFELDNLLAQMVSELSALHIFVYGGDKRRAPDNIQLGSLGARIRKDASGKGYTIVHIYQGDPDYPASLSPLVSPNSKIKEGDIITKINDVPVSEPVHINQLLSGKVNVWVKLTLQNSKGENYDQLVKPVSVEQETSLRYSEWELTRRQEVEQKSSSQIGYIHLRAMGSDDMNDFVKQFYPVFNRNGLILDVRHNGGGNIDSWVLEKFMRKAWFYWQPRVGKPYWNMQYAFRGHLVVLCDESTGSDGEAVTEGIRALKLGTIIGTRTWGGEIWLSSGNRLVDNGIATAAEHGVYADGKWLIEGHGVDPDITVDNEPYATYQGKDAQLEAAIKFLQDKIAKEPIPVPQAPAYPNKSFKYKE